MSSKSNDRQVAPTSMSLLQRAQSQDQEAWSRLVRLYGPLVDEWCRRSGVREEDTADVFQEVFRSVSTGLSRFQDRPDGSFRGWLRTITRNKIADHFQRHGRLPQARGGTAAGQMLAAVSDPLAADSAEEAASDRTQLVRRALDLVQPEFSPQNFRAFQRTVIEGESTKVVAAELGISEQAIRQANYRVRRRLKAELAGLLQW